ncbi:ATP-binding cassette sub-family C member 4 isoform X1 [Nematostella vectensis]|uniref:ATP-binding cassette sub-family C member 4 isoform X1 n=1 Tax=Nematostella vectensis TaxID=45351 RepID=UPI00207754AB|nr:ATP-binding cassette sub-family C member 4 isoform X1 [Nematostella vectensis]XP_048580614.1 ATP-binding cassette sub-family C member 4 isoform X1 [Nematostella vectensis]
MAQSKEDENQFNDPNCFSYVFMCRIARILNLGSNHHLQLEDLTPIHPDHDEAQANINQFTKIWEEEIRTARMHDRQPRLWRAVLKMCSVLFLLKVTLLKVLSCFGTAIVTVVLFLYLQALQSENRTEPWYIAVCLAGICFGNLLRTFTFHHERLLEGYKGTRIKTAVVGMIYQKVLSSSRSSLSKLTNGHIMNLISNDAKRMERLVMYTMNIVRMIFDSAACVLIIVFLIGWQGLAGLVVLAVFVVISYCLSKLFSRLRQEQCVITDKRLSAMNEIISGIRALKMNALEWKYSEEVRHLRRTEMKYARNKVLIQSSLFENIPVVAALATLSSVVALAFSGIHLSAASLFTLTAVLRNMAASVGYCLSNAVCNVLDANVALWRIQSFLLARDDCKPKEALSGKLGKRYECEMFRAAKDREDVHMTNSKVFVELKDAWASWSGDTFLTLRHVSLSASSNQVVMVTGPVGCGKTALLMAILKEIPLKQGSVTLCGTVAFVDQIPWVFSGTLRENILFGKEYDEAKYKKVIKVCSLEEDVRRLPKGDLSMIGQRGVSLSGGQRSRVSLARAVYSDADIFLMDDPLSAVDARVGQHIFDECIMGELGNKLRILATHQLQHLPRADHIVALNKGRVTTQGSYDDIKDSSTLKEMMREIEISRSMTTRGPEQGEADNERGGYLIGEYKDVEQVEEDRVMGVVTWRLYWEYLRAGLPALLTGLLIIFFLSVEGMRISPFWWLSKVSNMSRNQQKSGVTLGIFVGLAGGALVLSYLRTFFFITSTSRSSVNLHDKMTVSIIKSPVLFFDTNPVGRIMNRFSKDTGNMDDMLPHDLYCTLNFIGKYLGITTMTVLVNVWFVFVIIPVLIVFWLIVRFYLRSARELQRLEGIESSPLFAHVSDTMVGLETIRSFQMEREFMESHISNQNEQTRALKMVVASAQWLGMYIDLLSTFFVTAVAVGSYYLIQDPGLAGLLLTFAISTMGQAQFGVQMATEAECLMTSVERVITYTKLFSEPGYDRQCLPPDDWPNRGALSVQDVSLEYLEGGTRVLEGVNLEVDPKEKIGIVGRTGAGKSSLVAALFRMPEPKGRVLIDGVDLGNLDIQAARRAIAVVTQEPVVFAGSLRRNLDPFDQFKDQEIWTALENVKMKHCIENLTGKLEYHLGESGSGFSVGERQLLCLARASLQKCKLLVLDEATANVDYRTDRLVQQVIREKFADVTVLTIAHRVNTIMDYGKVVVMDAGHVVEYGEPKALAGKTDGIFAQLVKAYDDNRS